MYQWQENGLDKAFIEKMVIQENIINEKTPTHANNFNIVMASQLILFTIEYSYLFT